MSAKCVNTFSGVVHFTFVEQSYSYDLQVSHSDSKIKELVKM